jgi:hypothetical protein
MTIAVCYLCPDGVVLGADSASLSLTTPGVNPKERHRFNHSQNLFQIGEDSTAGILTWALAGLGEKSYRTLIAEFADDLKRSPAANLFEVANRWCDRFWKEYSTGTIGRAVQVCKDLNAKPPPAADGASHQPSSRTKDEEELFQTLRFGLVAGSCIGGYWPPDRTPKAYWVTFDPLLDRPIPQTILMSTYAFWGAPNPIKRLIFGSDDELKANILRSGKWHGTDGELSAILEEHQLASEILPVHDAIDFVHACIYSTIKALKFTDLSEIVAGPIEIAVIATDQKFRWVRHKDWDVAIGEG